MKKAFTFIEVIFVIVIIGILASIAIPKFTSLTTRAKDSNIKSIVSSVQSSIENIHGRWLIDDEYNWTSPDGVAILNSYGYPTQLDSGIGETELFKYVLKIPIPSCGSKKSGCLEEESNNSYKYFYNPNKILRFDYNATSGRLICVDGVGISKQECEKMLY